MDERDEIKELIRKYPRHFNNMIKKDVRLNDWVLKNTLIDNATNEWAAVIRSALYQETNICEYGNKRLFTSVTQGFKSGCGRARDCKCVANSVSKNVSKTKQSATQEQKDKANRRREETNLKKHGVANVGQTKKAKEAHAAFYADKEKVDKVTQHTKEVKLTNHGDENYNNSEQIKKSLNELHDAEYWVKKTSNENYRILHNKEELTEYINGFTILELVEMFNVTAFTILRHAKKHKIQLPERKTKRVVVYDDIEYTQTDQLKNKYSKWYYDIVNRGKIDRPEIYTESHHIIPECFYKSRTRKGPPGWLDGDPNDLVNLTNLTGREHFICHWLLIKMYEGQARDKMINALMMMQGNGTNQKRYHTKITARVYENYRETFSKNISKSNTGRKLTAEQIEKVRNSKIGVKRKEFSDEHKQNLSKASTGSNNPMAGKKHSEETKRKISEKAKGRKFSKETIEKRAEKNRGSKREIKICPHCGKEVAVNTYAMWHGDKCKYKNECT